jgi:hypothetical protein
MKLASFETVVRALNEAGVRYIVVGGLAVNAHGYGRATFDVDVVLQLSAANLQAAFAALAAAGYQPAVPVTAAEFADPVTRESWRRDKGMVVLKMWSDRHRETPLDVFVTEPFDFDAEHRAALVQEIAAGLTVPFLRLDMLLELKRAAGRPKDLADIDELNLLYGKPSSYDRSEQT